MTTSTSSEPPSTDSPLHPLTDLTDSLTDTFKDSITDALPTMSLPTVTPLSERDMRVAAQAAGVPTSSVVGGRVNWTHMSISLRFTLMNFHIHLHHWVYLLIICAFLYMEQTYWSSHAASYPVYAFASAFCLGGAVQGLKYADWMNVIWRQQRGGGGGGSGSGNTTNTTPDNTNAVGTSNTTTSSASPATTISEISHTTMHSGVNHTDRDSMVSYPTVSGITDSRTSRRHSSHDSVLHLLPSSALCTPNDSNDELNRLYSDTTSSAIASSSLLTHLDDSLTDSAPNTDDDDDDSEDESAGEEDRISFIPISDAPPPPLTLARSHSLNRVGDEKSQDWVTKM